MSELNYTLVSDGSSDKALLPILSWLLREYQVLCPIQAEWADLRRLPNPPKDLPSRIQKSLDLYPCNLLFVHRDAERQAYARRKAEINRALDNIGLENPPAVCVVPVRMMEAWLLIDEAALRLAAGNPNGQSPLAVPIMANLEGIPNPKQMLFTLLKNASELSGRRLKKLDVKRNAGRVAEYINDFAQLRNLPAFRALAADIEEAVTIHQWAALI